mmetsp:Transcript_29374/g.84386  ORF Transcript_29374/g.84386 Transcript_29374/m.84386 type:complete len:200 (-) Transcript_29374:123-722(-)
MQQSPLVQELQGQAVAGLQAGWALAQEKAREGLSVAKERIDTARAGKELLNCGGVAAEQAIRAKMASRQAAAREAEVAQSVASALNLLDEAVARLREGDAAAGNLPEGIGGLQDFQCLAEAYEARASTYRQLLQGRLALPPPPEMCAAEEDAARILQLKDHCQLAAQRTVDKCKAVAANVQEQVDGRSGRLQWDKNVCL